MSIRVKLKDGSKIEYVDATKIHTNETTAVDFLNPAMEIVATLDAFDIEEMAEMPTEADAQA